MAEDLVRPADRVQVLHPVREQPERKDRQPPRKQLKTKRVNNPHSKENDGEHGTLDIEA
jgi:hypothetical protein